MNHKYQQCALAIAMILSASTYAKDYGGWSNAKLAPGINTAAAEGCPIESPNGRNLYFMSTRNGGLDNWRATWNPVMRVANAARATGRSTSGMPGSDARVGSEPIISIFLM